MDNSVAYITRKFVRDILTVVLRIKAGSISVPSSIWVRTIHAGESIPAKRMEEKEDVVDPTSDDVMT